MEPPALLADWFEGLRRNLYSAVDAMEPDPEADARLRADIDKSAREDREAKPVTPKP